MKILVFLLAIFLFIGCSKTSKVDLRSSPAGANIYDTTSKKFIAKAPAELTYVFDTDPNTPECEIIPPITAVWDGYDAMITEKNILICPNKDYIITINQSTFTKPKEYKLVEHKEQWSFMPYIGTSIISSEISLDITESKTNISNISSSYLYKIGFVDNKNNRLEINYTTLQLEEKDLNLYSLDSIIPMTSLRDKNTEPYFKFGLGYSNYSYSSEDYSSPTYTLGFGFYGYITKSIELDIGFSNINHINYGSIAKEIGFNSVGSVSSKIDSRNILMGLNYKF